MERTAKTVPQELKFFSYMKKPEMNVIGRDKEIERLIEVLYKKRNKNCVLVGEAGVGKTTMIREVSERMKDSFTFLELSIGKLEAGTQLRGSFEERFVEAVSSIGRYENNFRKKVVVFIDEIHTICTAGGLNGKSTELTAANILKPLMTDGGIIVWGATTPQEYAFTIAHDKALMRRLPPININEIDNNWLKMILFNFIDMKITDSAIESIVSESKGLYGNQPDKAIELADRCMAKAKKKGKLSICTTDVKEMYDVMKEEQDSIMF